MPDSPLILALDAGSLSARCTLFDTRGVVVASTTRRLATRTPSADWQEQDAGAIWAALLSGLGDLGERHDLGRVVAAGLTNQRATCLLWDRASGDPLGPAIFWADRRTEPAIAALRDSGHELLVQSATGVTLHSFYSAPKLRWMLDHLPGAGGLLAVGQLAGGTLDSWLLWQLTGGAVHATDYSNAQRTMLMNLSTRAWSRELARLFGVAPEILPQIAPGARVWGTTHLPTLPRLRAPIGAVAADQTAALLGHGALAPGEAKCSYGTSVVPLMFCGSQPTGAREGMAVVAYDAVGAPAYGMGSTISGGALALEWCCAKLGAFASVEDLVAQAAQAPPDDSVVFVPAFAGLNVADPDPTACAAILGLHAGSDRRSIARAALESIAFQVADALALMREAGGIAVACLRADGGLAHSDLLIQMQADLLGIPVERPAQSELAALGVAYLAAIGAGIPIADDFLAAGRGKSHVFMSRLDPVGRQRRMALWREGVARASGWDTMYSRNVSL
jgi:glycerol kinase